MNNRATTLPVLLLRNFVPFPKSNLTIANSKFKGDVIFATLEKSPGVPNEIGAVIKRTKKNEFVSLHCAKIMSSEIIDDQLYASVAEMRLHPESFEILEPIFHAFILVVNDLVKLSPNIVANVDQLFYKSRKYEMIFNTIVTCLDFIPNSERQVMLESQYLSERIKLAIHAIESHITVLRAAQALRTSVKDQINSQQTHAFLREQLKATQKALEEYEEGGNQHSALEKKIQQSKMPEAVKAKAQEELSKLQIMSPMSAEAAITRNFIENLAAVPWGEFKREQRSVQEATDIIDREHYGLEEIKQRIKEYIAVLKRTDFGQVLCLVGPPGVGKTSIARSFAKALGRDFTTIQLGGLKDASEIYGHRRTYIGAMPGKIVQTLQKAGSMNCVILLDEVDKMTNDWRGDPSSALLSVLDSEQNTRFKDHYLEEVEIDLSKVIFIATANTEDIAPPLLDRMEVMHINSYTESEKYQIALNHLMPKALAAHHCKEEEIQFEPEILKTVIGDYAQESGVRKLKQVIEKLVRKAVYNTETMRGPTDIKKETLHTLLGPAKYMDAYDNLRQGSIGTVIGLAWTQYGGTLLPVQSVLVKPGKGEIIMTGNLGKVMQESARAAFSVVKFYAKELNVESTIFDGVDLHFHAPEAAIGKDGPSAGAALATAFASRVSNRPVRSNLAMTGEIDLNGNILAVGGIKEKVIAAHRHSISTVLIPIKNRANLHDVPQEILDTIEIIPVTNIQEVWKIALT